jgi:hypothetical protein
LNRGQKNSGQVIILIILVLLGLVLIFALFSSISPRVRPSVPQAFWTIDNQRVTNAAVGQLVTAHVVVAATEEYVGSIVLKIRKDIRLWFDSDFQMSTIQVDLKGGQQHEIEIQFTPDQASGGSLRGYFIEVDFKATGNSWVMENSYPPRLEVTTLK